MLTASYAALPSWFICEASSSILMSLFAWIVVVCKWSANEVGHAILAPMLYMRRVVYTGDSQIMEYMSGLTSILMAIALYEAAPGTASLRKLMTHIMSVDLWALMALVIGVSQMMATHLGSKRLRAQVSTLALWQWLVFLLGISYRGGFTLIHPFLLPLTWCTLLSIFMLLRPEPTNGTNAS